MYKVRYKPLPLLTIISAVILCLIFSSCEKENVAKMEEMNAVDLSQYIGNYDLTVDHISGIHSQYDSVGNFISFGIDTFLTIPMPIVISQLNDTDSFLIEGLITNVHSPFCCSAEVHGVIENGNISLVREYNTSIDNDYVRGFIVFSNDKIFVDYRWDRSDTWSSEAFPFYGLVRGQGTL